MTHKLQMGQQRLHELAVGGIVQQRKAQLVIVLPGMRTLRRKNMLRICVLRMVMSIVVVFEFTLKVGRKDRVHGSSVDVTGFSMMWIRLRMDMEQRQGQQPQYRPGAEQAVESEESAVSGTHVHTLLSGRYHKERNTSRNEQGTRRILNKIRMGNKVVCYRKDLSGKFSFLRGNRRKRFFISDCPSDCLCLLRVSDLAVRRIRFRMLSSFR